MALQLHGVWPAGSLPFLCTKYPLMYEISKLTESDRAGGPTIAEIVYKISKPQLDIQLISEISMISKLQKSINCVGNT